MVQRIDRNRWSIYPLYERSIFSKKAAERVNRIHEIQQELKAGKSPNETVPLERGGRVRE
jgi:hypothetical protein